MESLVTLTKINFSDNFCLRPEEAMLSKEELVKCLVFRKEDLYFVITQKLIFMKFGRFHEIQQISCAIKRHSLPTALHKTEEFLLSYLIYKVFRWISWNLLDFTKSTRFHQIWQISQNPPDFMESGGFRKTNLIARNGNAYVCFFNSVFFQL